MPNMYPNSTYVSCIKIGGVPILPPLMTPERRSEMEMYKRRAIEVEKSIKSKNELPAATFNKTLENSLAFDSTALSEEREQVLPETVPLNETETHLTCNIFDVTEYNNEGIILFNKQEKLDLQLSASASVVEEGTKRRSSPRLTNSQPRLLRSNSYTLDAPSPVLLEHFKQHMKDRGNSNILTSSPLVIESPPSDGSSKFNSTGSLVPQNSLSIDHIGHLIEGLAGIRFGIIDTQYEGSYNGSISIPVTEGSQSVCSPENLNTSSVQLIDFESDTGDNLTPCFDNKSVIDVFDDLLSDTPPQNLVEHRKSCARELFIDSPRSQKYLREEWAATVLTSAARGYLVRRLKRTERVKTLIQTISDTLLCAMALHSEQTDRIQPADVELHRRLIQQISAACYEFHDIFFNLSTKEQMEIINLDRQRVKEKLKRPSSSSSSKLDSDRSSRSQRNSFHTKQKKALVTSLVA